MKKKNHNGRWLVMGAVLGAAGACAGISRAKCSHLSMNKVRAKAANAASRAGHSAGSFISSAGDSVANFLR